MNQTKRLALLGGPCAVNPPPSELFRWPVLDHHDEAAALAALRDPDFPNDRLIRDFEIQLGTWVGAPYVSAEASATNGITAALFACGVGPGDEVIVPTCTYWATCMPVLSFGAMPVFCDVDPRTLNIAPEDIARKLTSRTKAIVVAHLLGQPCDMDVVNCIAKNAGVLVIEDAAHALGSRYKGRNVGTTADLSVFSFSRKALSLSEGGAVLTDRYDLFERVLAWGHTERFHRGEVRSPDLLRYANIPLGGVTSRMNAMSAALGHVQLGRLPERMAEIDSAMTVFCDLLDDLECITPIRTPRDSGSTMGTWYTPHALYDPDLNHGLSLEAFKTALVAEGFDTWTWAGFSHPLHLHPVFRDGHRGAGAHAELPPDTYRHKAHLPAAETIKSFALPAFRRCDEITIRAHADAVAKVIEATPQLLASG